MDERRFIFLAVVALALVAALALAARGRETVQTSETRRYMPPAPKCAAGTSTPLTYTLHLGCESADLKSKYPKFFSGEYRDIVEARLVFHNYDVVNQRGEGSFFEWDEGLVMKDDNLQPGDLKTFTVTTNKINYEYGFALKNKDGDILYEIGENGVSPLEGDCVYGFGKYRNRVITTDWKRATDLGFIDITFGQCSANCMPGDPSNPWDWPAEAKKQGSQMMKKYPPKGLNGQFIMYGENKGGICTMNLHTQRGTCDDILTHFDPRPKDNQFITDNQRCKRWQGQYETMPWKKTDMGSTLENDNTRWKFTFQYHKDGLNILLNEKFYHKYKWSIQDGGYNTVSYIQIEFLQDKHHRQGVKWADPESSEPSRSGTHGCTLLALMPPRTPLGAAAFDEP